MKRHSPHRNGSISPNHQHKPLWRRRREEAEADDYRERLSPNRKSTAATISPSTSPHRERKDSWHEMNEDDNDEYVDRAERAYSGLERYEKKFKRYTPEIMDKENINTNAAGNKQTTPQHHKNSSSSRARSTSPKPTEIERDMDVLIRRQKDIDYGKNTENYQDYITTVPKSDRLDAQPWTPDKYEKMTRRNWDKQVKIWRKQLHYWKDPKPVAELLTPGTSPCPSPHRNRSPERAAAAAAAAAQNSSARALFKQEAEECAMDSFDNQPNSEVQPILSQAALNCVKQLDDSNTMDDDNSNSRMSCDTSEEPSLPQMFKKH